MNKMEIYKDVMYDIESGMYDSFPSVVGRLNRAAEDVLKSYYVTNYEPSSLSISELELHGYIKSN